MQTAVLWAPTSHRLSARSFFFKAASRFVSCSSNLSQSSFCGGGDGEDVRTHSIHAHICSRTFDVTFDMRAYVLTGRTEPLSVWDDHERRPQAGGVVPAVTRVTQQDLEDSKRKPPTSPTGDLTHFVSLAKDRFKLNK